MNIISSIIVKLIGTDTICAVIAKFISKLLLKASNKGGTVWDTSKSIIKQIHLWCGLFLEVYDDDQMTTEEEEKVAQAIRNQTSIEHIISILRNDKAKDNN